MRSISSCFFSVFTSIQVLGCFSLSAGQSSDVLKVAVFGLGGRGLGVLEECVKLQDETGKKIKVVAVCDDHADQSYNFYVTRWMPSTHLNEYAQIFTGKKVYPDTKDGIKELLINHSDVDRIFITSANNRHAEHLKAVLEFSDCKDIYIEKPLFKSIDEFTEVSDNFGDRNIQVGLTLRSAKITSLAAKYLSEYKSSLGRLQKVHSHEHVNFGHGLSIIMMNWRRYISQSGGLLIEKSVHDLDLACFFMEAVDVHPQSIELWTDASHNFYKKSSKQKIINRLLKDKKVRECATWWQNVPFKRVVKFSYMADGGIDWKLTMDQFFEEFPLDDNFSGSDIIPDTHALRTLITSTDGNVVEFDLDLKLNGFATQTERGSCLIFENGRVEIDMETSKMVIQIDGKDVVEFNLNTRNIPHAGGDVYLAHGILGTLPEGSFVAKLSDPSVQISSVMGLVSEYQALHHVSSSAFIELENGKWVVNLPK